MSRDEGAPLGTTNPTAATTVQSMVNLFEANLLKAQELPYYSTLKPPQLMVSLDINTQRDATQDRQ